MDRRWLGPVVTILGLAMVTVAIVGLLGSRGGSDDAEQEAAATVAPSTTAAASTTTSTTATITTTSSATSTTTSSTTSSTTSTTLATIQPPALPESPVNAGLGADPQQRYKVNMGTGEALDFDDSDLPAPPGTNVHWFTFQDRYVMALTGFDVWGIELLCPGASIRTAAGFEFVSNAPTAQGACEGFPTLTDDPQVEARVCQDTLFYVTLISSDTQGTLYGTLEALAEPGVLIGLTSTADSAAGAPEIDLDAFCATTSTTTTTTTVAAESVEEFVGLFATAIAAGDVDFLFDRLHPAASAGFGPDLCRSWIEREILTLENYQLTSAVAGPHDQSFTTPAGTGTIENAYSADVSFSLQGQQFNAEAGFALIDGVMYWLGQCR